MTDTNTDSTVGLSIQGALAVKTNRMRSLVAAIIEDIVLRGHMSGSAYTSHTTALDNVIGPSCEAMPKVVRTGIILGIVDAVTDLLDGVRHGAYNEDLGVYTIQDGRGWEELHRIEEGDDYDET